MTRIMDLMNAGASVPEGADAVVQIENTEPLPDRQDGERRIKIIKVTAQQQVVLWC